MARTRTARVLCFARPAQRAPAPPPAGGRGGPRSTNRRTPVGRFEIAVNLDLPHLLQKRRAEQGPVRNEPSSSQSAEAGSTSRAHDPTALDVLPPPVPT